MKREPWQSWYHVTGSTHGAWLRGDPRGWRTRHHREHVEGDYRRPPAKGTYENLLELSRELMERAGTGVVKLDVRSRKRACEVFVEALTFHEVTIAAIAIGATHYHVLAKFVDRNPRKWIGIAKSRSARALSEAGLCAPGGVWGLRCRCWPIADRAHQVATARYIAQHTRERAAVWTFAGGFVEA